MELPERTDSISERIRRVPVAWPAAIALNWEEAKGCFQITRFALFR